MPEENILDRLDKDKNMFYSFNLWPIHFVSINTEYYYYMGKPWDFQECVLRQWVWLQKDLEVILLNITKQKINSNNLFR